MPAFTNPAVADIEAKRAADRRVSMSRKECMGEGGWRLSSQILKENTGALHRYLDGASVRVTSKSFYDHLVALASEPPRKVRQPAGRYRKGRRPRTPQELQGLRIGNERRAEEARERREAKAPAREHA